MDIRPIFPRQQRGTALHHQYVFFAEQRLVDDIAVKRRQHRKSEVDLPVFQRGVERGRLHRLDHQADLALFLPEDFLQEIGEQVLDQAGHRPDIEGVAPMHRVQVLRFRPKRHPALGNPHEVPSIGGQLKGAVPLVADEQGCIQLFFQHPQPMAKGGL